MNWSFVETHWQRLEGSIPLRWVRLTAEDVDGVEGMVEQLAGRLQARYGIDRETAYREIGEWLCHVDSCWLVPLRPRRVLPLTARRTRREAVAVERRAR